MAANAGGNFTKVSSANCHWHCPLRIHAQYKRIQESTSTAPAKDMASADSVLTTTFWIFLECQTNGFTGQLLFSAIDLWVAITIMPWCESWFLADAKDASANVTNRMSSMGIGWNLMVTSACCLASWRILFPSSKVEMVARLICVCNHPSLADTSGSVFTDAYWREPTKARRLCRSSSVTGAVGVFLRSLTIGIGLVSFTYCSWLTQMDWSFFWEIRSPVKTNSLCFLLPNGYFFSSSASFAWNFGDPQQRPSSTWIPMIPSGWCFLFRIMKQHGSNGAASNPRDSRLCFNSWKNMVHLLVHTPLQAIEQFRLASIAFCFRTLEFCSVPLKKAVLILKLWMSHPKPAEELGLLKALTLLGCHEEFGQPWDLQNLRPPNEP